MGIKDHLKSLMMAKSHTLKSHSESTDRGKSCATESQFLRLTRPKVMSLSQFLRLTRAKVMSLKNISWG